MGVVLAHAEAEGEGFRRGGLDLGDARREGHAPVQLLHQSDQCRAIALLATAGAGELAQRRVGRGQRGAAQVRQRRARFALAFAALVDLHMAVRADDHGLVRLVEGQYVKDVAVSVAHGLRRLRQLQLPVEHALARAVLRGQAQVLDARAHAVGVAIGGVVMDGKFHTASR
ncbi:hypothetical protein D3C81_1208810 [compost metagenome]